jgi:hypothetical protein
MLNEDLGRLNMSQNKFKIGDLVEYSYKLPNNTPINGVGIVYTIHDITDGIYDTQQRFVYEILSNSAESNPIVKPNQMKKIK